MCTKTLPVVESGCGTKEPPAKEPAHALAMSNSEPLILLRRTFFFSLPLAFTVVAAGATTLSVIIISSSSSESSSSSSTSDSNSESGDSQEEASDDDSASSGTTETSGSDKSGNGRIAQLKAIGAAPFAPIGMPVLSPNAAQVLETALSQEIEMNLQKFTDR